MAKEVSRESFVAKNDAQRAVGWLKSDRDESAQTEDEKRQN